MPARWPTRKASGARRPARSTGSSPAKKVFDPAMGLYGRWFAGARGQHLLQRARPACRGGRGDQLALIYDAADGSVTHIHLCRNAARSADARRRDAGFRRRKGDRVILYMPMVPEAMVAMLACARIGAVHSVVFGGFAAKELATRIEDAQAETDLLGKLRASSPAASCNTSRCSTRRSSFPASSREACIVLQRPQQACELAGGRDHDWAELRGKAMAANKSGRLRAGAGDRSALYPLHLGHDGKAQGRGARQWRASGRAEMVDVQSLRHQARRGLVVRLPTSAGWSATATSSTGR